MPSETSLSTRDPVHAARARERFRVPVWSEGYFDISADGRLVCRPGRDPAVELCLPTLVRAAAEAGLHTPLLMRFPDILADRVRRLCRAFDAACARHGYPGAYTAVYPIKVNQQRCVVEHIVQALPGRVGLEAGSKPELMAVMAQTFYRGQGNGPATIVCNGYKDREYIRLALIGSQLGKRVIIVVEKPDELDHVLEQAADLGVDPYLGVRLRLASIAKGRWQNSGGEKSKFGLSAAQVLALLDRLRSAGRLDCLRALHFHVGSQVADLDDLRLAVREAARVFQDLRALGAPLEVFDAGGGLAVDYEGRRSDGEFSMNYDLEAYADTLVAAVVEACAGAPAPELITESGRALTAHHAVLITDVVGVERSEPAALPPAANAWTRRLQEAAAAAELVAADAAEALYAQVDDVAQGAQRAYLDGALDLAGRAAVEAAVLAVQRRLAARLAAIAPEHPLRARLDERLADKYFCNFSLFQSLPDVWGIGQVFPVLPLERLDEPLDRRGVLHDLTCDSDGQINAYPQDGTVLPTLPLHAPRPGERYHLGVFLVGAYQEILGDMHNLFGDTNSINVVLSHGGGYRLEGAEPGDRIDQLLEHVHYDPHRLLAQYKLKLERSRLGPAERQLYYLELAAGLAGYSYLEE